MKMLHEILARHTGQTFEKIVKDTERDFFMSPEEAKEYGIIDAVYSPPNPAAAQALADANALAREAGPRTSPTKADGASATSPEGGDA